MYLCLLFSTGAERKLSKRRHQWSTCTMIRQKTYHLGYLWWTISGPRMISADASLHTSCDVHTLLNETVPTSAKSGVAVCLLLLSLFCLRAEGARKFYVILEKMIENARIRSNPKIRKRPILQKLMAKKFSKKVKFRKNWSVRSS